MNSRMTAMKQGAERLGLPVQALDEFWQQRAMPVLLKRLAVRVIPFVRRSGVRILELEAGRVLCEMPLKGNSNHIGTMYAGALFTLAEFPAGALFVATFDWGRYVPIVTDLNMQFLKPARGPVRVELSLSQKDIDRINLDLKAQDKAGFVLEGDLKNQDGIVVAKSHARFQIRSKR